MLRRLSSFTGRGAPASPVSPRPPPPPQDVVWVVDQHLIHTALAALPVELSVEQRQGFAQHLLRATEREWLDFDLCMFELLLFFKLLAPDSLLEEFKWIFWTENELNERLTALALGAGLPSRNLPDFQLGVRLPPQPPEHQRPMGELVAKRLVIAIDYGSTHSGFAFASTTPPQTIHLPKHSIKQPTCVLLDNSLNLVAFGNAAKEWFMRSLAGDLLLDKFSASPSNGNNKLISQDYLYFENLKIRFFDSQSPRGEGNQHYCSPMNHPKRLVLMETVVSRVLMHLKSEALKECAAAFSLPSGEVTPDQVLWVLTVPAIWTTRNKMFMRKCALLAGLITSPESSDLVLALEPECSALAAKQSTERVNLNPGSKLLTFDCGGGTVDVCLIQVTSEPSQRFACKQLLAPSGGPWGSLQIDLAFVAFLNKFMGESSKDSKYGGFYQRMCVVNPAIVIELMEQWERLKCRLTLTDFLDAESKASKARKSLNLSGAIKESLYPLGQLIKRFNADCVPEHRVFPKQESILTTNAIKISLPMQLIAKMFIPTLDLIVGHCGRLYRDHAEALAGLHQVLLVGGLGSNPYLHFKFEKTFPQLRVLKSTQSSALVEVGAVKFGLQPTVFQSRKSNITLGVKTTVEWADHMPRTDLYWENRFYDPGSKRHFCRNMFKPFLVAGEDVALDRQVVQSFRAPSKTSEFCKFDLYTCGELAPTAFVTEPGCRFLCQLLVPVVVGEMAELELKLRIGLTEITAEVTKKLTGQMVMSMVLFDFDSAPTTAEGV